MNLNVFSSLRPGFLSGLLTAMGRPTATSPSRGSADFSGQRVVITGGTDGIGLQLARIMTRHGANLLIIGRQQEDLIRAKLMPGQNYVCTDLSRPDSLALVPQAIAALGWQDIDILIHNAAAGWVGRFEEQPMTSVDELIATNLLSPVILSQLLLPMLRQTRGKILFIGSVSAHQPCPSFAVYSATKAALSGFARSLRSELIGEIDVQVIHPGPTRTAFHTKSGFPSPPLARFFMSPETAANGIFRQLRRKHAISTLGSRVRFTEWLHTIGAQT